MDGEVFLLAKDGWRAFNIKKKKEQTLCVRVGEVGFHGKISNSLKKGQLHFPIFSKWNCEKNC